MKQLTFQLLIIVVLGFLTLPISHAQESNQAGLVIQYKENRVETYCISFEEETVRGYELLELSELELELEHSSLGVAVCKIEDMGCPREECLICEIPKYWSYWHLVDGDWVYSTSGAGIYEVSDGGVDGWAWGIQELPKLFSFDEICNPTPTPTCTPTFTYTPKPTIRPDLQIHPNQLRHPYQQTLHLFHRQPAIRLLATQLHPRPQRRYNIQLKR